MAETYKLAARPFIFPEGPFKGKLKGVIFIATSPTHTNQWFMINCGQFGDCFSKLIPLIPHKLVKEIMAALIRGDDVEFPGLYLKEQFDRRFNYEGSPVRFEAPDSYVPV